MCAIVAGYSTVCLKKKKKTEYTWILGYVNKYLNTE